MSALAGGEILVEFDRGFVSFWWPKSLRLSATTGDEAALAFFAPVMPRARVEDGHVDADYPEYNWLRYYGCLADRDGAVTHLRQLGCVVRVANDPWRVLSLAEVASLAERVARGDALDTCEQAALAATALAGLRGNGGRE